MKESSVVVPAVEPPTSTTSSARSGGRWLKQDLQRASVTVFLVAAALVAIAAALAMLAASPVTAAEPAQGRYGDLPWLLGRIALALVVAAGFAATARRWGSASSALPTETSTGTPIGTPTGTSTGRLEVAPEAAPTPVLPTTVVRERRSAFQAARGWAGRLPRPWAGSWGRVPRALAGLLLVGWLAASVAVVLLGERDATLQDLHAAISSGDVEVVGAADALEPGATGFSVVELHWTRHGIRWATEVVQTRGRAGGAGATGDGVTGRIRGDLQTHFASTGAPVRVEPVVRTGSGPGFRWETDVVGWRVAGWLVWPLAALLVLTLRMLVVSPEPWTATRWAWFWLIVMLPPFGALLYLLRGGPAVIARRPPPPVRRFSGGWALLLGALLSSMF